MKATYAYDNTQESGYGILRVNADILPPGNLCSFIIQRSSDGKCLTSSGWHDSLERLVPVSTWTEEEALMISLSPALVTHLNELEMYRLILYGEGYPIQRCLFEVPGSLYSPLAGLREIEETEQLSSSESSLITEECFLETPTRGSFPPEEKKIPLALIFGILFFLLLLLGVWYSIHTAGEELQTTTLSVFFISNH